MFDFIRYIVVGFAVAAGGVPVVTDRSLADPPTAKTPSSAEAEGVAAEEVTAATERGLGLLRRAGRNWLKNETCFSCHHQTLPMFAEAEASKGGFETEADLAKSQADRTQVYFRKRIELMNAGRHLPGGSSTAGFGLWALMLQRHPPDATTEAAVAYLLKTRGSARLESDAPAKEKEPVRVEGPWLPSCSRPPMTSSLIGTTVLTLMVLDHYATEKQRPDVDKAAALAETWLAKTPAKDTEDRVWRLWGIQRLGGDAATKKEIRSALIAAQNEDGGWSQTADMKSDAYATGQVLYVLRQTGTLRDDLVAVRATAHLVRTQNEDGSWLVRSRVKYKAQPYADNGDPHGKDQFLSVAATSWATAALATVRPVEPPAAIPRP